MARILKRPMFNRGGSTNNGIMTGLVDRKGYANGPTQAEIYAKEYEDMLSKIDPPRAKLPLGQIGLNLIIDLEKQLIIADDEKYDFKIDEFNPSMIEPLLANFIWIFT